MFTVALKNLRGHKLRTLFTAIAIALGVGFMSGTYVLTDTISSAFDDLFDEANAGVDAVVQGESPFGSSSIEGPAQRPDIDPSVTETVAAVDGVARAESGVFGIAYILGADGEPLAVGGAPSFGSSWSGDPAIDSFSLVSGRGPEGAAEVVIDQSSADQGDLSVGDQIQVQTLNGTIDVEVSGIARFGESGNLGGAAFVLMETGAAIEQFTPNGKIQAVYVVAEEGLSEEEVVARIEPSLPDGVEVITAAASTEESQDSVEQGVGFFRTFLTAIGLVSLVAGAFLIYNTFGIIIGQRIRELALLRALGSSRGQVLGSVVAESAVIGLLASILGLLGGIVLALLMIQLVGAIGIDLPSTVPVIAPRTVIVALMVGTVITVLSSLAPALRASRVAPIAALREAAVDDPSRSIVRLVIGLAVLVVGLGLTVSGATGGEVSMAALGTVVTFAGVVILGPFIVGPLVWLLGWPMLLLGFSGQLGRDNARRNPKRSAGTASALMLAVTIITFIATATISFNNSFNAATDRYLRADLQITSGVQPTLGPALVDTLEEVPEVEAVSGVQRGQIEINGKVRWVYGVNPPAVESVVDLGEIEGDLAGMGPDAIAVDRATTELGGWSVGTELDVRLPDGTARKLTVAAIYDDGAIVAQNSDGHYLVSQDIFREHFGAQNQSLTRIDVKGADGVGPEALRDAVEEAAEGFPAAEVRDRDEIKESQTSQLLTALGFLFVLLGLALVIGALGVTITLALSVFERTREIGLLRAVGALRGQLAWAIWAEALVLTLLGSLLGLAIGTIGGVAVVRSQSDTLDTLSVTIPVPFVVAVVIFSLLIGVAAAVVPAFKAARMNVLDAVTVD